MLGYYLQLAGRSLRRNLALTSLMVITLAFGVGASMTTLTVLHVLSGDPIPGKSHRLFHVQLEPRDARSAVPGEPLPRQLTRFDAEALLRAGRATRQAMMASGSAAIAGERDAIDPFIVDARWTSAEFFAMFDVPFAAGAGWTAADDASAARVAVIARPLAEQLFGTTDVVGRSIRVGGHALRVVGVVDHWRPNPRFYDLNRGAYGDSEQVFVPFTTSRELKLGHTGSTECWGEAPDREAAGAPCVWIQFWVELASAGERDAYRAFLHHYAEDQRAAGRFQRPATERLRDVVEWLDDTEVVPRDARLQAWGALGFLAVCLINTVGLLLTKFLRRSREIAVRRALGASRRAIFQQLLIEAGMIGLTGGVLGLGLAWLGLWAVRHQPTRYASIVDLDLAMLLATFALAVASSLIAGLLPAWRGCQVAPARQLKAQ